MLIEFNTFQKHSVDSKLSTNIYLMSVVFKSYKLKWTRLNVVRSSTLFTFAIIATIYQLLLQYKQSYIIRSLSNCGICIRCAAYFYIHRPKQPEFQPSGHVVIFILTFPLSLYMHVGSLSILPIIVNIHVAHTQFPVSPITSICRECLRQRISNMAML